MTPKQLANIIDDFTIVNQYEFNHNLQVDDIICKFCFHNQWQMMSGDNTPSLVIISFEKMWCMKCDKEIFTENMTTKAELRDDKLDKLLCN